MNSPTTPPDTHELFTGPNNWQKLPKGSIVWCPSGAEWVDLPNGVSAIPGGFYAIPKTISPSAYAQETTKSILEEAHDLVNGDRQQAYGDAYASFDRIAKMWSAYKGVTITPKDVACMMILMKVSRSVTSKKRDNWVDAAGYAELGSQIEAFEQAPE